MVAISVDICRTHMHRYAGTHVARLVHVHISTSYVSLCHWNKPCSTISLHLALASLWSEREGRKEAGREERKR